MKKRWGGIDGIVANAGMVKTKISDFSSEKDFLWYQKHNFITSVKFANYMCEYMGDKPKHNVIPTHSLPEEALIKLYLLLLTLIILLTVMILI